MSASKRATAEAVPAVADSGLPPHFHMTDRGPAWRPEVLAGMRALGIPDASLEIFTAPTGPAPALDIHFREGELRKVRRRDGAVESIVVTKLGHGYYCDGQRHSLFKLGQDQAENVKAGQDQAEKRPREESLREIDRPHGMPRLLAAWRPEGPSERKATEESWFRIDWSTLPDLEPIEITQAQLDSGECWALFQGIAVSSKRDASLYADLVKAQLDTFNIPRGLAPRFTGLNQGASGKWRYYLPDGRIIGESAPRDYYPIDGGRLLAGERADAWETFDLPRKPIVASELAWLAGFFNEVDPAGRLLLLACVSARSLICSVAHCETSVMLLGDTGAGKTSSANFVRGIIGPSPQDAPADSKFHNATNAGIETAIAPCRDIPIVIDDFHPSDTDTENDRKRMGQIIDALITSSADGMELRQRATREARKRQGVLLRALAIMTGESYDGGLRSRFRRMICLEYKRGEIDIDALASGWDSNQSILTIAGHALIRNLLARLDESERQARQEIRERDRANAESLFARLSTKRPHAEGAIVRSITRCYATAATGADMLDLACTGANDRPMANALSVVIESLALAQIDRDASGGPTSIDCEWIAGAIRLTLSAGGGYLLQMDSTPFDASSLPHADERLPDIGYARIAGNWEPRGVCLGNLSDAADLIYFRPDQLQDKLRQRALGERLQWKWNAQTFPAAMVTLEVAMPANDRATQYIRFPTGKRERRITVPAALIYPQAGHIESDETDNVLPAAGDEYESPAPLVSTALTFPAAPAVPPPAARAPSALLATSAATAPVPAAAPVVPNPHFLTTDEIATLPRQTAKPFDPLAAPRRVSKSQARKAERSRAQAAGAITPPIALPGAGAASGGPTAATVAPLPAAPAEAPRAPAAAPGEKRWPQRLAALDAESLCLLAPNGSIERRPVPPELRPETACAGRLAAFMVPEQITQLWLHPNYTAETDLPQSVGATAARNGIECDFAADTGMPDGWRVPDSGKLKPWTRLVNGKQEVSVIASSLDTETRFKTAPDAQTTLAALALFRAETGFWYRVDPAVTCEGMLRSLHRNGLDLTASMTPAEFPPPMRTEIVTEQCWARPLTARDKASGKFVHAFDKHGMYLATMSSLAVGFGKPEYAAEPHFDAKKAGYWLARIVLSDPDCPLDLPHPGETRPRQNIASFNWYVTPTLALASQLGATIEVREAWLFNETHQPFTPLYRRLRDARKQLTESNDPAAGLALGLLKSLYTKGIGNLASHKKRDAEEAIDLYRPDWRHAIVATARANIYRNLLNARLEPFAIRTDAIYVITENADPASATHLRLGQELGQWEPIGSMPLADLPTEFSDGRAAKTPQRYLDKLTAQMKRGNGTQS